MIVGLEIHIQLNTKTKLFCSCSADYKNSEPNTNVCPVCLGLPGNKPMLNAEALKKALLVARLLNCKINKQFYFSRKIYFYPDLPKNFQITQYEIPIGEKGSYLGIGIKRVHLEEDPAKIIYPKGMKDSEYSLIDYNRSGIPLVEIVTEPGFKDVNTVEKFLRKLIKELEYFNVYDPRKNTWRVDINVSLEMGYRVEIKNVSGFKEVIRAIVSEVARQRMMRKLGKKIARETRVWDDYSKRTIPVRKKEFEEEYGYILEPNLPKIFIGDDLLNEIDEKLERRPEKMIEKLVKEYEIKYELASSIVFNKLIDVFNKTVSILSNPKKASIWVGNYLVKSMNYIGRKPSAKELEKFYDLMRKLSEKKISERFAKEAIKWIFEGKEIKYSEVDASNIVKEYLDKNPNIIEKIKEDRKIMNYVVGEILKMSNYSVDPKEVVNILKKMLKLE